MSKEIVRVGQTWRKTTGATEGTLLTVEVIRAVETNTIAAELGYTHVGERAEYPIAEGGFGYADYIGLPIGPDGTPHYPDAWELVSSTTDVPS